LSHRAPRLSACALAAIAGAARSAREVLRPTGVARVVERHHARVRAVADTGPPLALLAHPAHARGTSDLISGPPYPGTPGATRARNDADAGVQLDAQPRMRLDRASINAGDAPSDLERAGRDLIPTGDGSVEPVHQPR